jgi:hypothetical protein
MFYYLIVKDHKFILSTSITFIHTINLHLNRKKSRKNREKERNLRNLFFAKNDFYFSNFSYKLPKKQIQSYQLKPLVVSLEHTDIFHYDKFFPISMMIIMFSLRPHLYIKIICY